MNDERDLNSYFGLSRWEQQCIDETEKTPDSDGELQNAKDLAAQKLWFLFQNAATSVAQLYKDRLNDGPLWVPFQAAAGSVTNLYKESVESHKPMYDLGFQSGTQKRNRDLLSWAKKKKQHIRREDLIAYITGRNPPPPAPFHPRPRVVVERSPSRMSYSHRHGTSDSAGFLTPNSEYFDMFREALAFSAANMRQHTPSSPTNFSRIRARNPSTSNSELSAFINEELTRHSRKRSPSRDVIMDSPTHKKNRYYDYDM